MSFSEKSNKSFIKIVLRGGHCKSPRSSGGSPPTTFHPSGVQGCLAISEDYTGRKSNFKGIVFLLLSVLAFNRTRVFPPAVLGARQGERGSGRLGLSSCSSQLLSSCTCSGALVRICFTEYRIGKK